MFKGNNKNILTICVILMSLLLTSSCKLSVISFEHVIAGWVNTLLLKVANTKENRNQKKYFLKPESFAEISLKTFPVDN